MNPEIGLVKKMFSQRESKDTIIESEVDSGLVALAGGKSCIMIVLSNRTGY